MVWVILPYYILWRFQHFCANNIIWRILNFDKHQVLHLTFSFISNLWPLFTLIESQASVFYLMRESIRIIFCWNLKRLVYKWRKTFVLLDISLKTLRMQTSVTAMMHFVFSPNVPLRCLAGVRIVRCSHNLFSFNLIYTALSWEKRKEIEI